MRHLKCQLLTCIFRRIAKNIILVGDQQQLGQPTKGNHPNESGKSVLEYLLDGKDTISKKEEYF